jgi:hypothetical protein
MAGLPEALGKLAPPGIPVAYKLDTVPQNLGLEHLLESLHFVQAKLQSHWHLRVLSKEIQEELSQYKGLTTKQVFPSDTTIPAIYNWSNYNY